MNIKQRLKHLEAKLARVTPTAAPARAWTDEEGADQMGAFLWLADNRGKDSSDPILLAWYAAAQAARQQGHTQYHSGLRAEAMAYWLAIKPTVLEHRRTHGNWVWDVLPRYHLMTSEEFRSMPAEEIVAALQSGSGHWSTESTLANRA